MVERLAPQVIPLEAKHQRLEQPLHDTNRQHRAPNVLEQQEPPTRSQHAANLGHRSAIIGNCAKRERAHHAVEPFVGKVERLRIADTQICVAAELAWPLAPAGRTPAG